MQRIKARGLEKTFKIHKSRPGMLGAFRDLFTREYRQVHAVQGIDLDIFESEVVGYIGENGAGKSTTIKMLTGILMPSGGEIEVNGMNPHKQREQFVRTIGVVFGQRSQLWWDIAVQESFQLLKKVYRVEQDDHYDHMIEALDIGELLDKPVRKLSLGQRMRCELAAALLHKPSLVFLDEPTIGLDVLVKLKIREFLKEMNRAYGTTILLTTHDIADIEALCQRVVVLDQGRIIYDGALSTLKEKWGDGKRVTVDFVQPVTLQQLPHRFHWQQQSELRYTAAIGEAGVAEVLTSISHLEIKDISIEETSTEQIIKKIYEEGVRR